MKFYDILAVIGIFIVLSTVCLLLSDKFTLKGGFQDNSVSQPVQQVQPAEPLVVPSVKTLQKYTQLVANNYGQLITNEQFLTAFGRLTQAVNTHGDTDKLNKGLTRVKELANNPELVDGANEVQKLFNNPNMQSSVNQFFNEIKPLLEGLDSTRVLSETFEQSVPVVGQYTDAIAKIGNSIVSSVSQNFGSAVNKYAANQPATDIFSQLQNYMQPAEQPETQATSVSRASGSSNSQAVGSNFKVVRRKRSRIKSVPDREIPVTIDQLDDFTFMP